MYCVVCLLAGFGKHKAAFVLKGYSVCDDIEKGETHWNVIAWADSYHDVVMRSRALT